MTDAKSTPKFQLLPPLSPDDLERLKASIQERGVIVAVVKDENGEVIDGHTRVMIAESLGIDYPVDVRAGLPDYEKRILAAQLNASRRHLTDAQKVLLGQKIEPDVAARAAARQRELAGTRHETSGTTVPEVRTRDEVAKEVGLGSGRTYERHKQVIERVAAEPDAPQLMAELESGNWDIADAKAEMDNREQQTRRERDGEEHATLAESIKRVMGLDADADVDPLRLRMQFSTGRVSLGKLIALKPEALGVVITEEERAGVRMMIADARSWLDQLEVAMQPRGLRVVS